MEGYFDKCTCWIIERPTPPIPYDEVVFFESSWDFVTNFLVHQNLGKINNALKAYPGFACVYQLKYVEYPQPIFQSLTLEEAIKHREEMALSRRKTTSKNDGILACAIFQNHGFINPLKQRLLVVNIEDCTLSTIYAAIQYITASADKFKLQSYSGSIGEIYSKEWVINRKSKIPTPVLLSDFYDNGWIERNMDMNFDNTMLRWDDGLSRLVWASNGEVFSSDFQAEAYYILTWLHPEGITRQDWFMDSPRREQLKNEYCHIYLVLSGRELRDVKDSFDLFCREQDCRGMNTAKSRIRTWLLKHETQRVNENFAQQVVKNFAINKDGKIINQNRNAIAGLPNFHFNVRL